MIAPGKGNDDASAALLVRIECEHATERRLCDVLERIADRLPGSVDRATAIPAIGVLRKCLKWHITLQERYLLPMLVKRAQAGDSAEALSAQVAAEHTADEALAHDIADQLERAIERGRVENPEMLGYMLHGFFECRRRHLTWEETVILPLAKRRLRGDDWRSFSVVEFDTALGETDAMMPMVKRGCGYGCGCGETGKQPD